MEIEVLEDPAARVVDFLLDAAQAGGQIVLTGGSTPRRAYEACARAGVSWREATVWFSDERCVPPSDERSNFGMVDAALLGRLPKDERPRAMRMEGELGPEGCAVFLSEPRFESLPVILETPGPDKRGPDLAQMDYTRELRRRGLEARAKAA